MSSVRLLLSFMLLALVTSVTAQHGFRINGRFKMRPATWVGCPGGGEDGQERSLTDGSPGSPLMLDYDTSTSWSSARRDM